MTADAAAAAVEPPRPANIGGLDRKRVALGYLALAAPALLLGADTLLAIARGWRTESRLDQLGMLAIGLWLAVVTLGLALHFARRFFARYSVQLIALTISACGAWLLGELALGPILARTAEPFHGRRPGLEMEYHPQPGAMRGIGPTARATFNSWGVRGQEPPPRDEAYRILCLGGSSTACTYLDDAKTWPRLLQDELNADASAGDRRAFWVGNAGVQGFRSDEHLRFVEESPIMDRIDCLVVQAGINDFMSCLAGPRPAPPLWTQSQVWQLARTVARRSIDTGTLVEDAAGAVYPRRRAARQAAGIDPGEPELEACLEHFAGNLRRLIESCRQRGVRVVATTQPVLWRADLADEDAQLLWFGRLADGRYLSVDQLRAGIDRYNEALREVCRRAGVDVVDLGSLDGDPSAFYDDCHFTESGASQVARLLAEWFDAHPARDEEAPPR